MKESLTKDEDDEDGKMKLSYEWVCRAAFFFPIIFIFSLKRRRKMGRKGNLCGQDEDKDDEDE